MNVKKVTRGLLMLTCAFVFMGCPKKEPNVEPAIDSETETALDAVWATQVVTDIEQLCAFMGENQLYDNFYQAAAGSSGGVIVVRDSGAKFLSTNWQRTTCLDGRFREGTISMEYKPDPLTNPKANPNANYYRDFGFVANVTLSEYKVDNWLVKLYDGAAPFYIYNLAPNPQWTPKTTNLSWRIAGKILLVHPTDTTRNIIWDGDLTKELTNTSDVKVFPADKLGAIKWKKLKPEDPKEVVAIVKYSGHVNGSTHKNHTINNPVNKHAGKPFQMIIEKPNALLRDFNCYPDMISSIATTNTTGVVTQRYQELHPFVAGIASFTTGTAEDKVYPRQIYFGNEGHNSLPTQCDNVGEILIKGISYRVNFRE